MYFYVVLHPRHKLQYFKNAGWLKGWIDTARGIVETQYKHAYASRDVEEDDMSDQIMCSFFTIFFLVLFFFIRRRFQLQAIHLTTSPSSQRFQYLC
jgi:hypothetical protein